MKQGLKRIIFAMAAVTVVILGLPLPAQAAPESKGCQDVTLPVALAPGAPANQTLSGTLCLPEVWANGTRQVDVLVHGGTYNRSYWDFPVSSFYSYVGRALQSGRATFAFDQIGAGTSSKPLSALVTLDAAAFATHQSVQWLRDAQDFAVVTLVGHSVGSYTAIKEAGTYHDIDKLVVTGALHAPGVGPKLLTGPLGLFPAALDPQFAGQGLDLGYVTVNAQARASMFYSAQADPSVIQYDVAHKDVLSSVHMTGIVADLATPAISSVSKHVTVPVLVLMGEQDTLFCGLLVACTEAAITANEAPYYAAASSFTVRTVANTGHNLTLHPTAQLSYDLLDEWIASRQ